MCARHCTRPPASASFSGGPLLAQPTRLHGTFTTPSFQSAITSSGWQSPTWSALGATEGGTGVHPTRRSCMHGRTLRMPARLQPGAAPPRRPSAVACLPVCPPLPLYLPAPAHLPARACIPCVCCSVVETETGKEDISNVRTSKASPAACMRTWLCIRKAMRMRNSDTAGRGGGENHGGGARRRASRRRRAQAGVDGPRSASAPAHTPPNLLNVSRQGMFLERGQDPIIAGIEARIAKWTLMPAGNGEGLQVLVRSRLDAGGAAPDCGRSPAKHTPDVLRCSCCPRSCWWRCC